MILLDQQATAKCDEPGCEAQQRVQLVLGLGGGTMFLPPEELGWQLIVSTRPGQPVSLRCPLHNRKVDTGDSKVVSFRRSS